MRSDSRAKEATGKALFAAVYFLSFDAALRRAAQYLLILSETALRAFADILRPPPLRGLAFAAPAAGFLPRLFGAESPCNTAIA